MNILTIPVAEKRQHIINSYLREIGKKYFFATIKRYGKIIIEVERVSKVGLKNELQAMRHANLKFNLKFATGLGGAACATVLAASALYAQSQDPTTLLGEIKTLVQPHLSGNGTK